MNYGRIAIIVLHYKNLDFTRACLASLKKITPPSTLPSFTKEGAGGWCRVILVNNDKIEDGKQLKNEFADIKLIQNKTNTGFAEGNNVGIRHALLDDKTDAVLILNNDTEVEPIFLNEMIKKLSPPASGSPETLQDFRGDDLGEMPKGQRGLRGADMIAPRMMQYNNRNNIDNLGIVFMKSGLPFNRLSENQKLFCPSAGCALYTRALLEAIVFDLEGKKKYFDSTFFAYAEDLDLGFRAKLAGFESAYAPDAVVYHHGSASTAKLSDFAVFHTYRNLIWTQFTNYPFALFLRNIFWIILGWKLIFFVYLIKGKPGVISSAIFSGIRGVSTMKQKRHKIQKKHIVSVRTMRLWFENGLFPKNLLK